MQPQDLYKLVYQNEFGPGHFIENEQNSMARLAEEFAGVSGRKGKSPIESIGNGLCRYYLWGTKERELPMLNRIFVLTANGHKGTVDTFEKKLTAVGEMLPDLFFSFSPKEYFEFVRKQRQMNYPAVSHSKGYRNACLPAYRVVDERYAPWLSVFTEIAGKVKDNPRPVIGIDGNAAAGKTTLAESLTDVFDCECVHMDDFFLPPSLRTEERLQEVGGNVHYERFLEEIVRGIRSKEPFTYRVFSCHEMDYVGEKRISNRKMIVVEGAYSMRPEFRKLYDFKIFMKISEREQERRIVGRNGEEMWQVFRQRWIPMENRYFEALPIKELFDLVCMTDKTVDGVCQGE